MGARYYEDVELGERREFDVRREVTEAEIVDFGERFEPWVHHVDPDRADESDYVHQLTAGTAHVIALGVRLFYDAYLADAGALDAVGVEEAWRKNQVLPGDTLGVAAEAVDAEPLSDIRGLVAFDLEVVAVRDDVTVLEMTLSVAFRRRPDDDGAETTDADG